MNKTISVFVCLLFCAFGRLSAQHTFREAEDPVPMTARSVAEWAKAGMLQAQWVSVDSLYSRSEVPVKSGVDTCRLVGWKGERVSAQLLLWTGVGVDEVGCKIAPLTSSVSTMDADVAVARFVRYTIADRGGYDCRCERGPKHPKILAPDMLDTLANFRMDKNTVRPVWITIRIPQDVTPGVYKTIVEIKGKGTKRMKLPLELEVIDQLLPPYNEWSYHLDLWQHPSAVARAEGLEMWSDEHFEALKKQMRLLAEAGQKVITTTLNRDPWGRKPSTIMRI